MWRDSVQRTRAAHAIWKEFELAARARPDADRVDLEHQVVTGSQERGSIATPNCCASAVNGSAQDERVPQAAHGLKVISATKMCHSIAAQHPS